MNASLKALLNEQYKLVAKLREENKTLKDKIEFLTQCLDDRDKSIELMKEENKKLKESLDIATKCSSKEEDGIIRLNEENKKLKEYNGELIENHKKDIAILCEENKKLKHKNELQEKALIKLCLKHYYDSIIIEGEEVIDMSNYKVVEKGKPQEEKLF